MSFYRSLFLLDDDGEKHYEDDYYWVNDTQIVVSPLNQEDVDTVKKFVESLSLVYSPNEELYNIVTEEADAYFNGQKTAQEVAEIIQSRVSIYVNENSSYNTSLMKSGPGLLLQF